MFVPSTLAVKRMLKLPQLAPNGIGVVTMRLTGVITGPSAFAAVAPQSAAARERATTTAGRSRRMATLLSLARGWLSWCGFGALITPADPRAVARQAPAFRGRAGT